MSFFGTKDLSKIITNTIISKGGKVISQFLEHDKTPKSKSSRKYILNFNNIKNNIFKEPNIAVNIEKKNILFFLDFKFTEEEFKNVVALKNSDKLQNYFEEIFHDVNTTECFIGIVIPHFEWHVDSAYNIHKKLDFFMSIEEEAIYIIKDIGNNFLKKYFEAYCYKIKKPSHLK